MHIAEVVYKVSDQWEGVLVAYGNHVDFPVVLYWSHFAVLFVNKEK